ncbi:MAG: Uma2 family endonuclease [Symploca sp. SIO1B1]|nr:Uma2 family endonuclease [Symploca sp. SIO1B1]
MCHGTTLAKDLGKKKQIYAAAGIKEYWVSDLKNSRLKVFRDEIQGEYQTELTLIDGTISPLSFPNVAIAVRKLFS